MTMHNVAKITVDDAVAFIVPDSMACILAMDSDFDFDVQTEQTDFIDHSTASNSPVSMSSFEIQSSDWLLKADASRQRPQDKDAAAAKHLKTLLRRVARPRKTERRAVAWSAEEHAIFLEALDTFCPQAVYLTEPSLGDRSVGLGKGVAQKIADMVGSRDTNQVRSHAQKYFQSERRKPE
eukprot:2395506-Rhodomonas_salina.3